MVNQNLDWPNHPWGRYVILLNKIKQRPLSDPEASWHWLTKFTLYSIWPKASSGPIWCLYIQTNNSNSVCVSVHEGGGLVQSQEIEEMCYSSLQGCFHSNKLIACVASPSVGGEII